jgi:hypothetical protein
MKSKVAVFLIVVLGCSVALTGQSMQFGYQQWVGVSAGSKVAFVNGVLLGITYTILRYCTDNPGQLTVSPEYLLPQEVSSGFLVQLIDRVYADPSARNLPVLQIIVEWQAFRRRVGM